MELLRQTACYIDLDQIGKNYEILKEKTDGIEIMPVLKADAYGHGAPVVMNYLLKKGARRFAVAALNEAVELRRESRDAEILILGWTPDELLPKVAEYGITQTVFSYAQAKILSDLNKNAKIHIKVDTGMNRLGFMPTEESADEVKKICALPSLNVEGIFSHLSQLDYEHDKVQHARFEKFLKLCAERGVSFKIRHLVSGKNGIRHPEMRYDLVRTGSVITGFCLGEEESVPVKTAMTVKTRVARVHVVPAGEGVGYDLLDPSDHDRLIATLPFGYADGMPKAISNHKGWVGIRGERCEICGTICMDMCMADVTGVPGVSQGDEVEIYGGAGMDYFDVREVSGSGLSNLQILVGKRVPRVYLEGGKVVEIRDGILR